MAESRLYWQATWPGVLLTFSSIAFKVKKYSLFYACNRFQVGAPTQMSHLHQYFKIPVYVYTDSVVPEITGQFRREFQHKWKITCARNHRPTRPVNSGLAKPLPPRPGNGGTGRSPPPPCLATLPITIATEKHEKVHLRHVVSVIANNKQKRKGNTCNIAITGTTLAGVLLLFCMEISKLLLLGPKLQIPVAEKVGNST